MTKILIDNTRLTTALIIASITAIMVAFLLMQEFFTIIKEVDVMRAKPGIVAFATQLLVILVIAITFHPELIWPSAVVELLLWFLIATFNYHKLD